MTRDEMIEKKTRSFMAYIPDNAKNRQLRSIIELLEKDRLRLKVELEKRHDSEYLALIESNQVLNKMEGILND